MITMANVRAGNKMVVMETCQGLLIGASLERMGGVSTGVGSLVTSVS